MKKKSISYIIKAIFTYTLISEGEGMDKREEFKQLLFETKINSLCSKEEAELKIKKLQEWIIANIPDRLYHFRSNTDYAIDALEKDQIWGSTLWEFNDPYECIPFFDRERLKKSIENEDAYEQLIQLVRLLQHDVIPKGFEEVFGEKISGQIIENVKNNLDENKIKENYELTKQQIESFIQRNFSFIANQFFTGILQAESQRHIVCLSECNDSTLMWGHYANGHRGFCIEYDFKSILKPCQMNCSDIKACNNFMLIPSIAPVVYDKSRFDATSHLAAVIQADIIYESQADINVYHEDTLLISKCLLTKSSDWDYEKEWRLFSPPSTPPIEPHKAIYSLKPMAVYIGSRSSVEQDQKLSEICKKKNIPCYKMVQNYYGDDFKVFPMLYDDYTKGASTKINELV